MKIKLFLTVLIAIGLIFAFSSCDQPEDDCEHVWSSWSVLSAATCLSAGTQERTCSLCEETQDRTDPDNGPLGHNVPTGTTLPADCGNPERIQGDCSRVGCSVPAGQAIQVIPGSTPSSDAHTLSWQNTTAPTAETDGLETATCNVCKNHTEDRPLYATGTFGLAFELISGQSTTGDTSINNAGHYRVREGTVATGAVFIPAMYRPNPAVYEYFEVREIGATSDLAGSGAFGDTNITAVTGGANVNIIGGGAFEECENLVSISLPEVKYIGVEAFVGCIALTTVTLPKVTEIGDGAFGWIRVFDNVKNEYEIVIPGCTALVNVNFPLVEKVGVEAFAGCIVLENVQLPLAKNIGEDAFNGCIALGEINLGSAQSIGAGAFANTGSKALTVILPNSPPTLGDDIFYSDPEVAKTVTVRAPSMAAYGTAPALNDESSENWGNGFRGGGWKNGAFDFDSNLGSLEDYINALITIVYTAL